MLVIQLTPQMRIFVAVEAADFRKGIDGLCGLCRSTLKTNPITGAVFVFRNKRRTAIKILVYDGQGYWLCHKRLSNGKFNWWPQADNSNICRLAVHELQLLIWNGNPEFAEVAPPWKEI
jgi:transposase